MKKIFIYIIILFTLLYSEDVIDSFGTYVSPKPMSNMELKERIEGLTSIVEGLSLRLRHIELQSKEQNNTISSQKLLMLIKEIKEDCISKEDLNALLLKAKPKSKRLIEGIDLFKKHHYKQAKSIFESLIEEKYKQASANFYLGEMQYHSKAYDRAINYFKKSIKLSDSTPFVKILILHSAISLEKVGKKLQAIDFYNNLIENYPDSKEAKQAKKRLRSLAK